MAKLEFYDLNCWRIVEENTVMAMILRYSNDKWGLFDADSIHISPKQFDKPKNAFEEWKHLKGDIE